MRDLVLLLEVMGFVILAQEDLFGLLVVMRYLKFLSLEGTSASDAWLVQLKMLVHLEELNVARTEVSEAGANDLMQALPGLKVTR